jgi:TIR domain-containing protein
VRVADIFISYTKIDRAWAFWIAKELEALGHTHHIHEWEIKAGDDILRGFGVATSESRFDVFDQTPFVERLRQKPNSPRLQRSCARSLFRKGCDEDYWRPIAQGNQMALQLNPAQTRHLHVGDHALRVIYFARLQKLFGRRKRLGAITERSHPAFRRLAHRYVVVNY